MSINKLYNLRLKVKILKLCNKHFNDLLIFNSKLNLFCFTFWFYTTFIECCQCLPSYHSVNMIKSRLNDLFRVVRQSQTQSRCESNNSKLGPSMKKGHAALCNLFITLSALFFYPFSFSDIITLSPFFTLSCIY